MISFIEKEGVGFSKLRSWDWERKSTRKCHMERRSGKCVIGQCQGTPFRAWWLAWNLGKEETNHSWALMKCKSYEEIYGNKNSSSVVCFLFACFHCIVNCNVLFSILSYGCYKYLQCNINFIHFCSILWNQMHLLKFSSIKGPTLLVSGFFVFGTHLTNQDYSNIHSHYLAPISFHCFIPS